MHPILFSFGPLTIRTYGFLVALGLFAALHYLVRTAKRKNIPENAILDLVLYAVVAGMIGARLTYVALNWGFYVRHPADIFKIWEGGLVFYGGFLAGAAAVIVFLRQRQELRLWTMADLIAPALALGHFFGRLGCFFAGCCYGVPSTLPWAVRFTHPDSLCQNPLPLHPVQLYEAAGNLALFFVLDWYNRGEHREGNTFAWYLLFYGVLRFLMEFLRMDDRGGFIAGMSPSQLVALVMMVIAIALFRRAGEQAQ
jgi:phosphatidylglycerol:prolipoprotein diacylglycerol transferase